MLLKLRLNEINHYMTYEMFYFFMKREHIKKPTVLFFVDQRDMSSCKQISNQNPN